MHGTIRIGLKETTHWLKNADARVTLVRLACESNWRALEDWSVAAKAREKSRIKEKSDSDLNFFIV